MSAFTTENIGNVQMVTWAGLTTNSNGNPWQRVDFTDKCVQIFGNFGSGATVVIQGSNDPRVITDPANAVWTDLTDAQGTTISKTAAAIEQIVDNPRWIRPRVTGGTSPSITVVIAASKGF
jgi:hypothetical protein